MIHSLLVLRHGDLLLIVDQCLDGIERICHIGDAEALWSGEIVDGSAFLDTLAAPDAVLHHAGEERKRAALRVGDINGIIGIDHQTQHIVILLLIGVIERIKSLHILHMAGINANFNAFIHSVVKD